MALEIESSGEDKVKIPDFKGKKKGKTKVGRGQSRVNTDSENYEFDSPKPIETKVPSSKKKEARSRYKSDYLDTVKANSPFTLSEHTVELLHLIKFAGPANASYLQVLKSAIGNNSEFLASKKDVAQLLGISPYRAGQVLKELVDKDLIVILKAEDSTQKVGKTYRINSIKV